MIYIWNSTLKIVVLMFIIFNLLYRHAVNKMFVNALTLIVTNLVALIH